MYSSSDKICSFYASGLHLTTILMEYIYEKTKEGRKILNILEIDLLKEAESVLELLNCKKALKADIKNIGWEKIDKKSINNLTTSYNGDIIIIAGSKSFIDEVKKNIPNNNTIIDCYEILEDANDAMEVLKNHDYILMTNGMKKITDVFN